jgi:hypothetical protein
MEENKQSLLGEVVQNEESSVVSIPSLLTPNEEQNTEMPQPPSIQTEVPLMLQAEPPADDFKPPTLLENPKTDEEKKFEPPELIARPMDAPLVAGIDIEGPPTPIEPPLQQPKAEAPPEPTAVPSNMEWVGETEETTSYSGKLEVQPAQNEMGKKLSKNEQLLQDIQAKVDQRKEEMQQEFMMMKNYEFLKPAFESIQKVLDYQRENAKQPDFYDQHYTVAETQSLFNSTVNQLTERPYWRG